MTKYLTFRTVAVDSRTFAAGTTIFAGDVFEFFGSSNDSDEDDLIKQSEEEIIKWLLSTEARKLLLEVLEIGSDVFIDYSVRKPVIENPDRQGDIDILICPFRRPDIAVAIQCKPLIVKSLNQEEDDDIKKLGRMPKLVAQANRQRNEFGFHRNYLAILIKVDGKKKQKYNSLYRGVNQETFQAIYEFPDRERVHPDVGIIFIEIVQPTSKSFDESVVVGICVETEAARLSQNINLTNRIEALMKNKGVTVNRA